MNKEKEVSWLKKEIGAGFMLLSALNLKGRPAADDLKAVAQIWHGLLLRHDWRPECDAERIGAAFQNIAATSTEWPNPADLVKYMPERTVKMVPKLDEKHQPTEYGRTMLKQIAGRLKDAPVMNRDWIHGPRHRTPEECKRIYYAERQKGKK
ncbi:hypothetical protein [Neisseria musculi]|uniref:Uncharacterized protein n=1 Tax=Neisseria musculi TaxID=1815583 RepID=A0A7H1M9F5_9NEIS|nr:hypothetical protein [Neisseria musculi]QNT58270.1 hypothetical protein H7A79_1011 [Neisseria musculi]